MNKSYKKLEFCDFFSLKLIFFNYINALDLQFFLYCRTENQQFNKIIFCSCILHFKLKWKKKYLQTLKNDSNISHFKKVARFKKKKNGGDRMCLLCSRGKCTYKTLFSGCHLIKTAMYTWLFILNRIGSQN